MKIRQEHYKHMRDEIKLMVDLPALNDAIRIDGRYKDFGKRFRWDAAYKAGLSGWIADNLYSYMDDSHVDTALKAIIKELS
jgi:hypothetical protein